MGENENFSQSISTTKAKNMSHQVLSKHNSFESAFLVEDYPYGRTLRCQRKCWIETASKGAKIGQMRFVSCTTNPKSPGKTWNKPHAGQYIDFLIMYLDAETGYVQTAGVDISSLSGIEKFKAQWYEILVPEQRTCFDIVEQRARQLNSITWKISSRS